jgi:hypothetical protein
VCHLISQPCFKSELCVTNLHATMRAVQYNFSYDNANRAIQFLMRQCEPCDTISHATMRAKDTDPQATMRAMRYKSSGNNASHATLFINATNSVARQKQPKRPLLKLLGLHSILLPNAHNTLGLVEILKYILPPSKLKNIRNKIDYQKQNKEQYCYCGDA